MTTLEKVVQQYSNALDKLEGALPNPSTELVLDILLARDAVHAELKETKKPEPETVTQLISLDSRLNKYKPTISQMASLEDWVRSRQPHNDAWWWFISAPSHPLDRWDWVGSALAIVFLTISLSLVVDISSRFLSGGSDTWAAFAVIAQSVLTMIAAGGTLTKIGRGAFEGVLKSLKVPNYWWQETRAGLALIVSILLIIFRLLLPEIAVKYNNRGFDRYQSGQIASAQYDFNRAIKLCPDYPEAHYNLGLLYEYLLDFSSARTEYQIAVKGGLDAAYNNLARLYILDGNFPAAVSLLLTGLKLAQDDTVEYAMQKNLGWSRLEQGRYAEAETYLREALSISDIKAPAHCLLAQVLVKNDSAENAKTEWEKCLQYAVSLNPDEDAWIDMANKYLIGDE